MLIMTTRATLPTSKSRRDFVVTTVTLALFCAGAALAGSLPVSAQSVETREPRSPRIAALEKEAGNPASVQAFWDAIAKEGAPIIERVAGDSKNMLVTFILDE